MSKFNKYNYLRVIQQNCAGYWEDVSEYDQYDFKTIRHDLKECRMLGYPTRVISRRVLNDSLKPKSK